MNMSQYNLLKEKKLIDLLGYDLVGPNKSNRWLIMDKNQNQVGYIQYKKLHNGNSKKGYSKIFGYQLLIDSPSIYCNFIRRINDKNGKILDSIDNNYSFDIKRDNQEKDHVEMNLGEFPSLIIWSEQYGLIDFKVHSDGLYLNFKSQTNNFNIEELLIYKNIDNEYYDNKRYVYQIRYSNKNQALSDDNLKGKKTREICGIQDCDDKNKLRIIETSWIDGKQRTNRTFEVEGTIEEMVVKHQMGIDCFSHFRYLINKIIPFNKEIISIMISDIEIKENNLSIFLSDEVNKESNQRTLTKSKNKE